MVKKHCSLFKAELWSFLVGGGLLLLGMITHFLLSNLVDSRYFVWAACSVVAIGLVITFIDLIRLVR